MQSKSQAHLLSGLCTVNIKNCSIPFNMKKVPLQYYQLVLLDRAFSEMQIPVDKLCWYMDGFLPDKYFNYEFPSYVPHCSLDKEQFKKEIILGGSSSYEALIHACDKAGLTEMSNLLCDHEVKQLYRYVWIWSEDNSIMRRGTSWFTCKEKCLEEGKKHRPSYYTCDGPGAPDAHISVEAVCPCSVHSMDSSPTEQDSRFQLGTNNQLIAPPCLCFTPTIPEQYRNKSEIKIDGLTFMRRPVTLFSLPPSYEYVVKETQDIFFSTQKDIYVAYCEYRRRCIISQKQY